MKDKQEFFQILGQLEGRELAEYKSLVGDFDFTRFVLKVNRVGDDAGGAAVWFVVRVAQSVAGIPPHLFNTPIRRTALEDFLARNVAAACARLAHFDATGVARRRLGIAAPGQQILPRSSMVVSEDYVEARMVLDMGGSPGAALNLQAARDGFFEDLPAIVNASLIYCNLDDGAAGAFVDAMEDADSIRQALSTRGWLAFVADGSRLQRLPGQDQPDPSAPALRVDEVAQAEVELPNSGPVRGLGIPMGITVVLGADPVVRCAFTHALAEGIYNHAYGDGRERVVTAPDAVYVSAERSRPVQRVDVGPFLSLPAGHVLTDADAGAAMAQAASVVEVLEIGARALIFEETDSAPAFLAVDERIRAFLGDAPRNSLLSRARQLADEFGVSIVVSGESLASLFIPVADTILRVEAGKVVDATKEARQLGIAAPQMPASADDLRAVIEQPRWVIPSSLDPSSGLLDAVVDAPSRTCMRFGREQVDLSGLAQLSDVHQTSTIALILNYGRIRYMDEPRPIREILDLIDRDLSTEGLECLTRELRGDLARPRRYEIAAALNRLRSLRVTHRAD